MDWMMYYQKCLDGSMTPADIDYPLEQTLFHLSQVSQLSYLELKPDDVDMEVLSVLSLYNAMKFSVLPLCTHTDVLQFASLNPFNPMMLHILQNLFARYTYSLCFATPKSFTATLEWVSVDSKLYLLQTALLDELKNPRQHSNHLQHFIHAILEEALRLSASDVHIESGDIVRIRMRVDGILIQRFCFETSLSTSISSQLKLMSQLDISEKRKGQDGRFRVTTFPNIDFRISTLPIARGESIVIRILDSSKQNLHLEQLGFDAKTVQILRNSLKKTHGILFITGPTGSGKTTTLYALLQSCNKNEQKIITIEDPIEYEMHGIIQVILNDKIHFGYPDVLRNILRHDPDILMVGEVRDQESLHLAFHASLTGHLVLCSLHTNDALESIARLLDMGIEPYFLASSLLLVVSQRLLPRLCTFCQEAYCVDYKNQNMQFYRSKGCSQCYYRGFLGRELISEVLPITPTFREALYHKVSKQELRLLAQRDGFMSMNDSALDKATKGLISLESLQEFHDDV